MHTVVACLSTFVSTWIRTDSQSSSSLVGRACSCLALGPWGGEKIKFMNMETNKKTCLSSSINFRLFLLFETQIDRFTRFQLRTRGQCFCFCSPVAVEQIGIGWPGFPIKSTFSRHDHRLSNRIYLFFPPCCNCVK